MAMLLEMGFRDQRLNQRLLRKHGYSLLHTINELVQMAEDSQNKAVGAQQWGRESSSNATRKLLQDCVFELFKIETKKTYLWFMQLILQSVDSLFGPIGW